ncbi:MAG: hypothetical protein ACO3PY_02605 [Pontimonas sp.]
MPKSGDNARPYNRNQKRSAERNKAVRAKLYKLGDDYAKMTFGTAGPDRMNRGAGEAAQMTRSTAKYADEIIAARMRSKPQPK